MIESHIGKQTSRETYGQTEKRAIDNRHTERERGIDRQKNKTDK